MKKIRSLALVGAGPLSRSSVARLPGLTDNLAFVKSKSVRVASRLVNNLGAGVPVDCFEAIKDCRVFLICVPAGEVNSTMEDMTASDIDWKRKIALLWDVPLGSPDMGRLAARGASVGTLGPIEGADRRYLVEGSRAAVAEVRRILPREIARIVEVRPETKALFAAGLAFATTLYTPLIAAAVHCFRNAGVDAGEAGILLEITMERARRGFLKAGKKAGRHALADRDEGVARQIQALCAQSPELARYFIESSVSGMAWFGQDTAWFEKVVRDRQTPHPTLEHA